jgi:predicted nucleic acid-binding protein
LAEGLNSRTSQLILDQLIGTRVVVELAEDALQLCKPYLPAKESADIGHAATCLQTKAVLITNDSDFDQIKQSGTIEVWSISEAMRKLLTEES